MGNFHVKPKMDAPVPAPPPAPKAKVSNTQAGAVACDVVWPDGDVVAIRVDIDYADELLSQYKWRDCKKVNFVYTTPPAVVPVEDLVKLVERMTAAACETDDPMFESATLSWRSELTQLIKEHSNGR